MVDPGEVDDLAAAHLAHSVARRMENDLRYSNHIQVTVIRKCVSPTTPVSEETPPMTTVFLDEPRRRPAPAAAERAESRPPTRTGRRYFLRTFGCQMNEHDSERVAGLFESDGMTPADRMETADVIFINTCTIRENADNRLYGNLGQLKPLKEADPGRMLIVGGCAAQKDRELVRERAPWVDVVLGTHNLDRVLHLLDQAEEWGPVTEIADQLAAMPSDLPVRRESAHSAWVTIQVGCNNTCTFCIVPAVRGPEISRRPGT